MKNSCYRLVDEFGIENIKHFQENIMDVPPQNHVLIKLKNVSLNYRDLLIIEGNYDPKIPLGFIPCSDGAGEVVAVGEGVSEFEVGDGVVSSFFQYPTSNYSRQRRFSSSLGGPLDGMLSKYRILPKWGVVKYSKKLNPNQAACLPCAGVVSWNALYHCQRPLKLGETVLILGSGGVGTFSLQLAKRSGANVIMLSGNETKHPGLIKMGADHIINYNKEKEWFSKVLELTDGVGVDHVIELGGAGTLSQSIRACKPGGIIHLIGVLDDQKPLDAEFITKQLMYDISIRGVLVGSRSLLIELNKAYDQGLELPHIDREFQYEEINDALEYLRSKQHLGKIVINMDD